MDYDYEDDDDDDSFIYHDDFDEDEDLLVNDNGGDDSDDDDSSSDEAVKDDPKKRKSERVIKMSFAALIKIRNRTHKKIFIDTVQKMVIKNTEIVVRGGMMMHHAVMNFINDHTIVEQLPDFCDPKFINEALNYDQIPSNALLIAAKGAYGNDFTPAHEEMHGRPWLLGYLARFYRGNVIASTKGKWRAVINDSITAYGVIHLRHVSQQARYRTKREIRRQIFTPGSDRPNTAPNLDNEAIDLVQFHRRGFLVQGNQVLDKRYINESKDKFHLFILHFGHCLQRQENLERAWNDIHPPRVHIGLKKRLPLPFYRMQQRKSVHIDKKGLYYILSEYRRAVRSVNPQFQFPENAPEFTRSEKQFNAKMFAKWIHYLFRLDKVVDGRKIIKDGGVVIVTNAVSVSVYFKSPPELSEEEDLLRSIQQLSLTPPDEDDFDAVENEVEADEEEISVLDSNGNQCPDIDDVENRNGGDDDGDDTIGDDSTVSSVYIHDGVIDLQGRTYELSNDPGCKNILQIQVYCDGQLVKTIRLTQNGYYEDSLLNLSTRRWWGWNNRPKLKELSRGFRIHHFKTSNMLQINSSMQHYEGIPEDDEERVRDKIRVRKLIPKKFERLRLKTYSMKQRTIHRFLSDLVNFCGEELPIMYYGNGSFAPGGKGQRSVPCKWVKRECRNFFTCYSVNEFRTSQICPTCNDRLFNVRKHLRTGTRRTVMVRGLKYCNSIICRSHRYKNRDVVGCSNIYRKTRIDYPDVMDRSSPGWQNPAGIHKFRSKY